MVEEPINGGEGPPEGPDVEKDVYVPMPFRSEILRDAVVVEGGRMEPTILLPDPLPAD